MRHRAMILDVAGRIFSEQGIDVPLDTIIVATGLGRGTLYRHFANRHELIVALLERDLARLQHLARECESDPAGFLVLFRRMVEQSIEVIPLTDTDSIPQDILERFSAICSRPLANAQKEGLIRRDLSELDLIDLTLMAGAALKGRTADDRRSRGPRIYELLMNGLVGR